MFFFSEELFYTIAKDYKNDPTMHQAEPSKFRDYLSSKIKRRYIWPVTFHGGIAYLTRTGCISQI